MINHEIAGLDASSQPDLILVNSPLRDYDIKPKDDYEVLPPLGLASIATQAAKHHQNVGLIDSEHHGLGQAKLAALVNNLHPRFAGINILTPTRLQAQIFAKNIDPDIPLIIGGPHATAIPEKTLREISAVHNRVLLIRGEAELAVTDLLYGRSPHEIQGAYWLEGDDLQYTPGVLTTINLDDLPQLDRKFLANDPSIDRHNKTIESRVLTALGCPFDCTFCAGARSNSILPVRFRNPFNVATEIRDLVAEFKINAIRFVDDLFISNEKRTRDILLAMDEQNVPNLWWDATGRANILSKFNDNFLDYLKDKGANEIAIGIESGSERLRKKIHKQVSIPEIEESIKELTKRGIKVKGYFIIGIPSETHEETKSTLEFAKTLTQKYPGLFRASIFIFRPYPGTKEWRDLLLTGYKEDDLLAMHADGVGERAKHDILTNQKFGGNTPRELTEYLTQYNTWQSHFIK